MDFIVILIIILILVLSAIGILYLFDKRNPQRKNKRFFDIGVNAVNRKKVSISNYLRIPNDAPYSWALYVIAYLLVDGLKGLDKQDDIIKNVLEVISYALAIVILSQIITNLLRFIKSKETR